MIATVLAFITSDLAAVLGWITAALAAVGVVYKAGSDRAKLKSMKANSRNIRESTDAKNAVRNADADDVDRMLERDYRD